MDKQNYIFHQKMLPTPDILPSSFMKDTRRFCSVKKFTFLHIFSDRRKNAMAVLAFSWTTGLAVGLCALTADAFGPAFYQAAHLSPSLFGIISVLLFPIVLTLLAIFAGQRWLIFPLAFFKALAFAYVGWSVVVTFGTAGWLIRLLFMFSDCVAVPLLLWFWNKVLASDFDAILPATVSAVLTVLGIAIVDYGVISPFLLNLSL